MNSSHKLQPFQPLPGTSIPAVQDTGEGNRRDPRILRVLGIDPGLASTGYGIVDYYGGRYCHIHHGVIETTPDTPHGERLLAIHVRLTAVLCEYRPDEAGMETLYFARNVTSAMSVAEARGVATLCLAQQCVLLGEYTPNAIKQAVTGTARADKTLVQNYVKLLLGLQTVPRPDHAADALAAAITHIHNRLPAGCTYS
jgi:crossover junction endodeoxyribonuclease RuvC